MTWMAIPSFRSIAIALLGGVLSGCGLTGPDALPPRLVRYEIVEGAPSCSSCPLTGPRIVPDADGTLVFHLNSQYTARAYVQTAGKPTHCVYRMIGYSWWTPDRSFACMPETKDMMFQEIMSTDSWQVTQGGPEKTFSLGLTEYVTATRTVLSSEDLVRFPVRFVP